MRIRSLSSDTLPDPVNHTGCPAATSADSGEPIVVSASRSYRTVSEMAQTTG